MLKIKTLALIPFLIFSVAGVQQPNHIPSSPAGITQLVESRGGRVSCWGVVVQLGNSRFRETIRPDQLSIIEGKHGHDLKEIMTWRVEQNGKRLLIKFKPATGDFGSGNRVEIQVDRSAFVGQFESPNTHFAWSIDTDVL
jgi:hypothetical protein